MVIQIDLQKTCECRIVLQSRIRVAHCNVEWILYEL